MYIIYRDAFYILCNTSVSVCENVLICAYIYRDYLIVISIRIILSSLTLFMYRES